MFTSHDVIFGRQTIDVATSKYATFEYFLLIVLSFKNSGFVFSGGIFSSHLKVNSIPLPSKITKFFD